MNMYTLKTLKAMILTGSLLLSGVIVSACGGGGGGSTESAGIGGTGITVGRGYVQGEVTQFGSIYVNGSRFDIDSSNFTVDGNNFVGQAGQDELALGMVVTLGVETEDGVYTGKALDVVYDDEIEGPLVILTSDPSIKTGKVFGQTITFDETSTIYENTSFGSLGEEGVLLDPDVIEVSGFRTSADQISATYVRFIEDLEYNVTEVELRGPVKMLAGVPPNETFQVDGIDIATNLATVLEVPGGVLVPDLYVEVEGIIQGSASVLAGKVEFEDEDLGEDADDVSLQGIISEYNGPNDFEIDGLPIDASGATELSPTNVLDLLKDGIEIEVEGDIVGGKLIADEVELREGETELRTTVSDIALPNRFQVEYPGTLGPGFGKIWVNTDGQTLFEDKDDSLGAPVEKFSIDLLEVGNFVKVKGLAEGGEVSAQIVRRLEPGDSSKLQGTVDVFERDVPISITILGVKYPIKVGAIYEDGALNKDEFFNQLEANPGSVVELEDEEPDAAADKVEFDD